MSSNLPVGEYDPISGEILVVDVYWSDTLTRPAELPIEQREAWHHHAFDREQDALSDLSGGTAYAEQTDMGPEEIWEA